jgi:CO/xanthine dehydrogenase FAD-binding subunit
MVFSKKEIVYWQVSFGGVAPTVVTFDLVQKNLSIEAPIETIEAIGASIGEKVAPLCDIRGSVAYRKSLVANHIVAHFLRQTGREETV